MYLVLERTQGAGLIRIWHSSLKPQREAAFLEKAQLASNHKCKQGIVVSEKESPRGHLPAALALSSLSIRRPCFYPVDFFDPLTQGSPPKCMCLKTMTKDRGTIRGFI